MLCDASFLSKGEVIVWQVVVHKH